MEKYSKLEQKIESMTAKEIVLAMLDGINNPVTVVDMTTFGEVEGGICYGCAATNMICKLGGLNPFEEYGRYDGTFGVRKYASIDAIRKFELAIDGLRQGRVDSYNYHAKEVGFSDIPNPGYPLPAFRNYNCNDPEVLEQWKKFANTL